VYDDPDNETGARYATTLFRSDRRVKRNRPVRNRSVRRRLFFRVSPTRFGTSKFVRAYPTVDCRTGRHVHESLLPGTSSSLRVRNFATRLSNARKLFVPNRPAAMAARTFLGRVRGKVWFVFRSWPKSTARARSFSLYFVNELDEHFTVTYARTRDEYVKSVFQRTLRTLFEVIF